MDFGNQRDFESEQVIKKSKKLMIIISITLVIMMIGIIGIIFSIKQINDAQFKVYIDSSRKNVDENIFVMTDDKIYVAIEDFAKMVGYTFKNGEYKHQYSEDSTKCFISNNAEAASYSLGSNTLYKALEGTDNINYEYFDIDEPVKLINNKLYTTVDGISKGCNVVISYDENKNNMTIYTLPYLVSYYSSRIEGSALTEKDIDYSNAKAIIYNLMVVKDETTSKYGVKDLSNQVIIGEKYKSISFLESSNKFVVTTDNDKVGIISSDGKTEIEPQYDSIKQIDGDTEGGLYLVKSNNKYGIINRNGKIIVYIEYDQIGLDNSSSFTEDNIDNQYLLYGEGIPVKRNGKWGLLSKKGSVILPIEYDGLGCILNNSSVNNLLLIPEYKAIVVRSGKYYGLFNISGDNLIPARVRNMYSITNSGKKEYYLTYDEIYEGQILNVIDYLTNNQGIKPIESTNKEVEINVTK